MARPTNGTYALQDGRVIDAAYRDRWAGKVMAGIVTRAEAAIACGVDVRTIDRWVAARREER